ncbi:MAG: OmpH family outer membrane protein [Acidobacteria bacterium]|nr:OmpH family outer membrane protein [Acidobacteriota bacterium]MBI3664481.1 OmpH family outer membrane protein [Acidobacteriota bacterium]
MNVKRAVLAAAALLLAPAAQVYAQAGGAAAAASQKVGILNVRQAVFSTAEGKQALAELQSQFAPRNNELDTFRKQIDDVQNRLRSGDRTLSDEEKARLQRQGELLSRQAQRKQQEFEEDAQAAQGEVFDRIARKMDDVMSRYARENSYSLVIDVSSQNVVVFAAPQTDITPDIVKLYDQAFPVRGGAAAPAGAAPMLPGTPRSSQPRPQPPAQKPPQR